MMHKQQAISLDKVWHQPTPFSSPFRTIIASLKNLVQIPTGYQDESGFHYGAQPAPQEAQSPRS
jgi:hypothetical protein